jgi:hypothetical protein
MLVLVAGCAALPDPERLREARAYARVGEAFRDSPGLRFVAIEDCVVEDGFDEGDRRVLADVFGVNEALAVRAFCESLIAAWASGRLAYDDFRAVRERRAEPAVYARVFQILLEARPAEALI